MRLCSRITNVMALNSSVSLEDKRGVFVDAWLLGSVAFYIFIAMIFLFTGYLFPEFGKIKGVRSLFLVTALLLFLGAFAAWQGAVGEVNKHWIFSISLSAGSSLVLFTISMQISQVVLDFWYRRLAIQHALPCVVSEITVAILRLERDNAFF